MNLLFSILCLISVIITGVRAIRYYSRSDLARAFYWQLWTLIIIVSIFMGKFS